MSLIVKKEPMRYLDNIKRLIILSVIVFVSISGCQFNNGPSKYIETNSFEGAYISIAVDINAAELCYKINPNAVVYAGFNPEGFKIISTRADCFYTVAVQTHNADLCKHVTAIYNGSKMTRANCEREANDMKDRGGISIGADHELILRLLGYNDEDVMKLKDEKRKCFNLYLIEMRKPEFRNKLSVLPDFSIADNLAKKELYSLAPECINDVKNNPLCFRINCGLVRGKLDPICWQK